MENRKRGKKNAPDTPKIIASIDYPAVRAQWREEYCRMLGYWI